MAKKKLQRFGEMATFRNVIQPLLKSTIANGFHLKGKWKPEHFRNDNPIVLELGCGKGEYTVALSRLFPDKNFIGVDIKGARMWRGAKTAIENNYNNVAFLRTRVEFLDVYFEENEVSEIWLTFPDPFMKEKMAKRRLSSSVYLNLYTRVLRNDGIVHLKTDNDILYGYTLDLLKFNDVEIISDIPDVYALNEPGGILGVKTFYEQKFLAENKSIHYLSIKLNKYKELKENPAFNDRN